MSDTLNTFPGRFFDGVTAGERIVRVRINTRDKQLEFFGPDDYQLDAWPFDDMRMIKNAGNDDDTVIHSVSGGEARFIFKYSDDLALLEPYALNLRKTDVPKGTFRKVSLWLGGAIIAVCLMLFVILPGLANTLAQIIPVEREEAIGRVVVAQVETFLGSSEGSKFCSTPAGDAALAKMTDRITSGIDVPYNLNVQVIKHPMVNAFAAPGGNIIFVSGLLEKADSPEEVAGVLAHELGHVVNRDPLRITLRTAGSAGILSMILGDVTGGAVMVLVLDQIMQASYTRQAEAEADDFAFARLIDVGLPTEGIAQFFDKLKHEHGDTEGVLQYLASHPNLSSRAQAARDAEQSHTYNDPVLTDVEWAALKAICD